MTIDPATVFMLLVVMFIAGMVCGVGIMGLWCYNLLIDAYRRQQNPFKIGSKRLDGLLGELNN